ncbi:unnamed protein product, partial [Linum tenue]
PFQLYLLLQDLPTPFLKGSNIALTAEQVRSGVQAKFVKSSVRTEDCLSDGSPDFALVEKSFFPNEYREIFSSQFAGQKEEARSSPSLLRNLVCFYTTRMQERLGKDYFLNRSMLVFVFLLIDASIPAKKIDLEYASWLGQYQVKGEDFLFDFEVAHNGAWSGQCSSSVI